MNNIYKIVLISSVLFLIGCSDLQEGNKTDNNLIVDQTVKTENNDSKDSKKIIEQLNNVDIDNDGNEDKVLLYLSNLEVILQVKEKTISLLKLDTEEQIFNSHPRNEYVIDLHVKHNKILVGITYSYTNKYDSTAWLECYEYTASTLDKIWSSHEAIKKKAIIKHYDEQTNTLNVLVDDESKSMCIDEEDEKSFLDYMNRLRQNGMDEYEIEFGITPQYIFDDYDEDDEKELLTRRVIRFGAFPIADSYISAYKFTENGITEVESWFSSRKPDLIWY